MDYIALQTTFKILAIILYIFILALDVLPAFLRGILATVLSYVGIGLHLALMPLMLLGGFKLEVMICAYAISVFAYTLARYTVYIRKTRADEKGGEA